MLSDDVIRFIMFIGLVIESPMQFVIDRAN